MRRLYVGALIASFLVVVPAGRADACSCALMDPASMLEGSDAAFVGTLVERPADPGGLETGIWVFEVETWTKGDMGATVGVHASVDDGGNCGLAMQVGDRAGIFLYNDGGRPSTSSCSVTTPEAMLSATRPLVFDGEGPPAFLVGADTGRTRLATLDASGRLLAAIGDDRFGWSVSVCPDGVTLVDVVEGEVTVRDAATLETRRAVEFPAPGRPEQAWCVDPDTIVAQVWNETGTSSVVTVLGADEPLLSGEFYLIDVGGGHLAVVSRPTAASVDLVEVASGERRRLVSGVDVATMAFSPDGSRLLVTEAEYLQEGFSTVATVYDVATGAAVWTSEPLTDTSVVAWVDSDRLLGDHYPMDAPAPTTLIIDFESGDVVELVDSGWGHQAAGNGLVSVSDGTLLLTSESGEPVALASLPSPMHRLVAVLDPGAEVAPVEPTTTAPTTAPETTVTTAAPAAAPSPHDPGFPVAVAAAAGAGILLVVGVGWSRGRRRPR